MSSSDSPIRDRSFRLLLAQSVGMFAGYALLMPVLPLWAAAGGASSTGAGSTTGMFMLTTVLTQPVVPWLLIRLGRRVTLAVGAVLLGAPSALFVLSSQLGPLLGVSALRGIGFGLVTVAATALVAELSPPAQRGRAAGYHGLAVGAPNVVALPGGVWLTEHLGYPWVFAIAAVLPLLGAMAVPLMRLPAAVGPEPAGPAGGRLTALLAPGTLMIVASMTAGCLLTFLPLGLPSSTGVSTALLTFSVTLIIGRWVAGIVADRLSPRTVAGAGILLTVAGALGQAAALGGVTGALGATLGAVGIGLGFGSIQNGSLVSMFQRAGPHGRGKASAVWNIGYDAGTGLGAVALGVVVDGFGFAAAFLVAAVLVTACSVTLVRAPRSRNVGV